MSATSLDQRPIDQRPIEINFTPTTALARRAVSAALVVPVLGAIIAVGAFLWVALHRIPYPYELDWLESGMLEHIRRLVHGQPLYTHPSLSFTEYPYPPVSFGVGAVFATIFGVHFSVMRNISFAATLATFALTYWFVRKETKNVWAAIIAVGIYAASYKLTATWFDIGKADALFLFVTMLSMALARNATTKRGGALAGFVMAVAIMTKQTALFSFIPIAIYLIATRRSAGVAFTISGAAFAGGTTLILNALSHGWFNYFVWEELFQHPLITTSKFDFIRKDLKPFWPVIFLVLAALPQLLKKDKRWTTGFYVVSLAGLIAGAWSSRLHSGGSLNVLMPAFLAAAVAAGLALGTLLEKPRQLVLVFAAIALCCAQLAFLRYNPGNQLPNAADKATGAQFINWLKTVDGPVFIYSHPTYAVMAGKEDFASQGGAEDVLRSKNRRAQSDLLSSLTDAIHQKRFGAIVLDGPTDARSFPSDWLSYYTRLPGTPLVNNNSFIPIDLATGQPLDVYEPIGRNSVPLPLPSIAG